MNMFKDVCDDILIDILTRLSVRQILLCRYVCRRWRCLILQNPTFAQVHLGRSRASPVPFFQIRGQEFDKKNCGMGLYFVDWEDDYATSRSFLRPKRNKTRSLPKMIRSVTLNFKTLKTLNPKTLTLKDPKTLTLKEDSFRSDEMQITCCCNGLLIIAQVVHPYTQLICNPTTNETAVLGLGFPRIRVCGFYFHLPTSSYRLLCVDIPMMLGGRFRYYICGLDLVELTEVGDSSGHTWPYSFTSSLTVDSFIYMQIPSKPCSGIIVSYDSNTEKIAFMPHPPFTHPRCTHDDMHLIEMESQLGFCSVDLNRVIDVWVLEDRAKWAWTKKYSVKIMERLKTKEEKYSLSIRKEELILWGRSNGVLKYNMVSGICEELESGREYWHAHRPVFVTNGKRSFVSPHHLVSGLNESS